MQNAAKMRAEAEAMRARKAAEAKMREEEEKKRSEEAIRAKFRAEAEAKVRAEMEAKARAEAEAREKAAAAEREKQNYIARMRAEAEAKVRAEAAARAEAARVAAARQNAAVAPQPHVREESYNGPSVPESNAAYGEAFLTEQDLAKRRKELHEKAIRDQEDTEAVSEQVSNEKPKGLFGSGSSKNKKNSSAKNKSGRTPANSKKSSSIFSIFGSGSTKKKSKDSIRIPRTVQESIPYVATYRNGIIEIERGVFTKSYPIEDVNFNQAAELEQEAIFDGFSGLLNTIDPSVKMQVSVYNRTIDMQKFSESVLFKPQDDGYNAYRDSYNTMILEKTKSAQNNIRREKYLTLTVEEPGIAEANQTFLRLDEQINQALKRITDKETLPMSLEERLGILYDIYNQDSPYPFMQKVDTKDGIVESFSLDNCRRLGIQTKDCIGPESMEFNTDYFTIGDRYGRTMFLSQLPTILRASILSELSSLPTNMLTSVHYHSMSQDKAVKLIRHQNLNINANMIDAQKKAAKNGYSGELISPELQASKDEAASILDDVTVKNQKLFMVTVALTIFAADKEELNKYTKQIQAIAMKYICQLKTLNFQQEAGFDTTIPLGYNRIFTERMLTTESASVFMPYSSQEIIQPNGMYYGLNADSKNMILFNRTNSKNANGVILGTPGSGKSFSAKREMLNVLLNSPDEVYVIDPEREYSPMAKALGGEVVKIAPGSGIYVNPMDMDLKYADDEDPIQLKADFICSLCETAIGGKYGLNPIQETIIDRCVRKLYENYEAAMKAKSEREGQLITFDSELCPTLVDFYNELLAQNEPEAKNVALSLERYTLGSLDSFAHRTNVEINNRFTIYDIKDIGSGMMEMGLRVCLNDIWNKMISNRKKNKRTWFYIDEFYLLTQTDSSAKFLQQIWKRARKWNGVPTGITQNVADLLENKEARAIISNSDFVLMLNQSPLDRQELAGMLNISSSLLKNITNAGPGHGLIYTGTTIIPFIDEFPKNNLLYPLLTSKPSEVKMS